MIRNARIVFLLLLASAQPVDAQEVAFTAQDQTEMKELVASVRRGSANAEIKLADWLREKGSHKEAERWYRYAFIQDSGRAGFTLCQMHKQGFITLQYPDPICKLSIHMMEEAAYKGDDSSALILGLLYLKGEYVARDYEKTVRFLQIARSKGKAMASYHLGNVYSNGLFASIQPRKALSYYKEASDKGVAEATRQLALAYLTGTYYTRDPNEAKRLFEKSIVQGDVEAMRDLANLYRYEEHNMAQYLHWMQRAAEAGNSDAQYYLGLHFEAQNPAKAREYFVAAATQKHFMARQKLPNWEKAVEEATP